MKKGMFWTVIFIAGLAIAVMTMTAAAQTGKKKITVPAGTRILVRMTDSIDSKQQKAGYRFTASLETNLQVDDTVVARRGTVVYGVLASAASAGRMSGSAELELQLTDIVMNGVSYPLVT